MIDTSDKGSVELKKLLSVIGDKWSILLLHKLNESGPMRFLECQHAGKINSKTLTQRLADLEKEGLITKKVYKEYPPRTEYETTKKGKNLEPIFKSMVSWSETNLK